MDFLENTYLSTYLSGTWVNKGRGFQAPANLRGRALYLTRGRVSAPIGGRAVPRSLLTLRPNQTAPTAVPTKISIPLSPARYSFTTTGFEVTVNAPKAL